MSVVAAVRGIDCFWLAADTQMSVGYSKKTMLNEEYFKVFSQHEVLMGGVGALRDLQIVRTAPNRMLSELSVIKEGLTFSNMVNEVVPSLFEALSRYDRIEINPSGAPNISGSFFIAYEDRAFQIYEDGCVLEVQDFASIGSGQFTANGAIVALTKDDLNLTPMEMAGRLVEASCELDLHVGFPIIIRNTISDNIWFYDGENFYSSSDQSQTKESDTEGVCNVEEHRENEVKETIIDKETRGNETTSIEEEDGAEEKTVSCKED